MEWLIIDSGRLSPQLLMDKDAALLQDLANINQPILHLYEWEESCLTYGYFIDPSKYLNIQALNKYSIKMARRPTGGGITFHLTDFAFSILVPATYPHFSLNTLDNYAFINRLIANSIAPLTGVIQPKLLSQEIACSYQECHSFCMAKPTRYDLVVEGKKLGGAAQRRTKQGFLHQGTLSLDVAPMEILKEILQPQVLAAIKQYTYSLIMQQKIKDLNELKQAIKCMIIHYFSQPLNAHFSNQNPISF